MKSLAMLMLFLIPAQGLAQATDFTPPPLVPVQPPPMPAPEPTSPGPPPTGQAGTPGTPPPPSLAPPQGSGYPYTPYAPYGQPRSAEKPGPEIGLMVSESLFGMLTSAGVTILPYFLLFGTGAQLLQEPTISSVIFILVFSAVPLAVAQTQVALANGSRHYASETWPAALAGLAAEAAVLGIFYLTGWLPTPTVSGGTARPGGSVAFLLIGSVAIVPIVQMVVINLTKSPKFAQMAALERRRDGGLAVGLPMPTPLVAQTREGLALGVNFGLLNLRF